MENYYPYATTASSTSMTYTYAPITFTTNPAPPKPHPLSPLEWLDREVEKTCALARAK